MATPTSRWYALGALALCTLAIGLDSTVLSVALPTLAGDLHASTGDLQWFTSAYLLVLAAALLPAGLLGDRIGRKRMLIGALAVFGAASAACAYATGTGQLIAARSALGLGAAVLMPMAGAVLTVLFDGQDRTRALSVWVTASALGIPLGPLLGGWLLDNFWWGSVFLINVPLVAVGLLAVILWVPESHGSRTGRADVLGILLSTAGLVAVTYGIIEIGDGGRGSWYAVAGGVVLLAGFVMWERRTSAPLVDLALFRNRAFIGGALLASIASFGMLGLLFALPQYFSAVGGHDAFGTGLRLLPVIGGLLVGSRVARFFGTRPAIVVGLVLIAAAMFAGARTGPATGYGYVAIWVSAAGLGLGLTLPPAMDAALGALSPATSGVGNGLLQAMRQVGGAIGVAVLGTVLNSGYRDRVDVAEVRDSVSSGVAVATRLGDQRLLESVRAAFTHGMDVSLVVAGVIAVAGAVLALVLLPARPATPAVEDEPLVLAESGL